MIVMTVRKTITHYEKTDTMMSYISETLQLSDVSEHTDCTQRLFNSTGSRIYPVNTVNFREIELK